MSAILESVVSKLNESLSAKGGLGSTLKFDIANEGSIVIDDNSATLSDGDAQCTLKMDADTFTGLLDGSTNPTTAFMSGKIKVEGDMSVAMKLSGLIG